MNLVWLDATTVYQADISDLPLMLYKYKLLTAQPTLWTPLATREGLLMEETGTVISPIAFQYFRLPTPINNTVNVLFLESSCDLHVCSYFQSCYLYMEYLFLIPFLLWTSTHFPKPYLMWPLCLFHDLSLPGRINYSLESRDWLHTVSPVLIFNKVSIKKSGRHRWYYYWLYILEKSLTLYVYFYTYFLCSDFIITLYLFTQCPLWTLCYLNWPLGII